MTCCAWVLTFAWGVVMPNGQNIDQDMLADAVPNQTLDDQLLLLQTNFQHSRREVLATAHTAFTLDYGKTETAFEAAGGTKANLPSESQLKTTVADAGIASDQEYAFFFANLMQESAKLTTTTESSPPTEEYDWAGGNKCPTTCPAEKEKVKAGTSCCGSDCESEFKCTKHYHGRGYLQTTYLLNYQEAKDFGCDKGGKVDIVDDPGQVATDDELAWCTAAYFWKKKVHDDRGCPACDLGATISAINGDQECETGANFTETNRKKAQNRWCYYAAFYRSYADKWPNDDNNCISDLDNNRDWSIAAGTCKDFP